jgi:hypothetical protein
MFANRTRGLILLLGMVLLHCADATKYQAEYRGSWVLESRKDAQGHETMAPDISGVLEWFPTQKDQANVIITLSTDAKNTQVLEGVYQLASNTFVVQPNLIVGGMLGSPIDESYQTSGAKISGQIKSEDARVILNHDNGMAFEFIGAQLTVKYKNGIVDRWKRLRDQKGALDK